MKLDHLTEDRPLLPRLYRHTQRASIYLPLPSLPWPRAIEKSFDFRWRVSEESSLATLRLVRPHARSVLQARRHDDPPRTHGEPREGLLPVSRPDTSPAFDGYWEEGFRLGVSSSRVSVCVCVCKCNVCVLPIRSVCCTCVHLGGRVVREVYGPARP